MKTLAILSALATLAIAAPALEDYSDSRSLTSNDFTLKQHREKKSTLLETEAEKTLEHSEDHVSPKTSGKAGSNPSVARSFSGFKKPIIVKKKIGYHVYRDSDEEQAQADSLESCKKQIKVKLCDDNNSVDKMKSASIDHIHDEMSESEMKHTINMAKEAVETFQRDLEKMEHNSVENIGHKHKTFVNDKELQKDIEKARQALEHINNKFNTIGSTTTTNVKGPSEEQLKMTVSDEKRMAQWKGAINSHKNFEIARNIEDNFKLTNENDLPITSHDVRSSNIKVSDKDKKSIATIEGVDAPSSFIRETKTEDGMTSVIEDKEIRMDIRSDSLKKDNSGTEDIKQKEKSLTTTEQNVKKQNKVGEEDNDNASTQLKQSEFKNNMECNDHEKMENNQHKIVEEKALEKHSSDMTEKNTWNDLENKDTLKSSSDKSAHDVSDHTKVKSVSEMNSGHLQSVHENDQVSHKNKQTDTVLRIDTEKSSDETDTSKEEITTHSNQNKAEENHNTNIEQSSTLKQKSNTDLKSVNDEQNNIHHDADVKKNSQEMELQHFALRKALPIKSELHLNHETGKHKTLETYMDPLRAASSMTTLKVDDNKKDFHIGENKGNDKINDHATPGHLRATSDFHRELLNNKDFIEDSHQSPFSYPSQIQKGHMMKNEKPLLLERHVPQVQPNSEHLQTMMHFSDNPQHKTDQRAQLKITPMFDTDQPNFNVQFNSPETFIAQTNEQGLIPFKSASNLQDRFIYDKDETLSDPVKIRWAHENNIEKLKAAHFQEENMVMDGTSQHFNVDKTMPFRTRAMDNQHLDFNDQFNIQQRWAQAKGMNGHNRRMMHEKSNVDNTMQPNSFMHIRGVPKMALATGPNQWDHNHGAFRSSYGPGVPAYGSGGGAPSGGSAVGLFPNANVGNCAVPLLLSCSPSVVSGSLAPTKQSSYSAPSYRSEDVNLVKKRNTDIGEPNHGANIHRHTPLSHNTKVILENKH